MAMFVLVLMVEVGMATAAPHSTEIVTRAGQAGDADRQAIIAALELLPRRPSHIAVIDVTPASPHVRAHLLTLDAFTVKGNGFIYIVGQSELLRLARLRSTPYRAMLAAVLWHEMTHLDGGSESDARTAEERLWTQFIRNGIVDPTLGLRYLQALTRNRTTGSRSRSSDSNRNDERPSHMLNCLPVEGADGCTYSQADDNSPGLRGSFRQSGERDRR